MKLIIEAKAYDRYHEILGKIIDMVPFEDAPFLINAMRMFLAAIEGGEPETYQKAFDMLPEEELRKNLSEIIRSAECL